MLNKTAEYTHGGGGMTHLLILVQWKWNEDVYMFELFCLHLQYPEKVNTRKILLDKKKYLCREGKPLWLCL
jgi:hypothetical protein